MHVFSYVFFWEDLYKKIMQWKIEVTPPVQELKHGPFIEKQYRVLGPLPSFVTLLENFAYNI